MDHIVRAENLRRRAIECESFANQTTSSKFKDCYLLLAKQYGILAQIEVEYAAGNERLAALGKSPHPVPKTPT